MRLSNTVGELRASGYRPTRVKDEIRRNLRSHLCRGMPVLGGLIGYEDTVLPEVVHGLLARHDLLLLGTRGHGKTRLLRGLIDLLDERIPVLAGTELRDDPLAPISARGREILRDAGDEAPVVWIGREERYLEKLATPDVTMADLFGDLDLMKHVQGRSLAEEGALHFGLIPRGNRGICCINELPDLSPKIQVGLFNLLQERDIQIRGHPVRFPLDVCMVFSANPEDYTSRGRIVTPLKDRIGSVVRTHDPRSRQVGVKITDQNAWEDREGVFVPSHIKDIIEEVACRARRHPSVNQQSGVSARLAIAARELVISSAEARALLLGEARAVPRISDLAALPAGARGKLELLIGEDEGEEDRLLAELVRESIRIVFGERIELASLSPARGWFQSGGRFTVGSRVPVTQIVAQLRSVPGMLELAGTVGNTSDEELASAAEFLLEGLHLAGQVGKQQEHHAIAFGKAE